jgi:hypothetical protein
MTLTYVGDLSTDLDKVRFYIGDTATSSGPLPSAGNFTDAELNGLITTAGSVNKAVSAAMAAISARWASYANITVGPRKEEYAAIAEAWAKRQQEWNAQYGVKLASTASVAYVTRIDGWSDDISADER